jgi:vacuolar protein sorting-associated protein 45
MSSSNHSLDGIAAIRQYVDRIVHGDEKCRGSMKVLLLDAVTTQVVSSVYSQTEILNQQVYLVSRLDETGSHTNGSASVSKSHLKAVVFCRPTQNNVNLIAKELSQRPRFLEYHIFFSGILPSGLVRVLAESDRTERVRQVKEIYADFLPVNEDLTSLQCRNTLAMTVAAGTSWAPKYAAQYERNIQGLQSMLLALKRQPSCIRYAGHSACAEELAKDMHDAIQADEIFHFRRSNAGGLLLLVLDRRDDPVTPLLSQWTYQAMVHELLGLNNHRVILRGAPNVTKDLEEVVLAASQDDFFHRNRHSNFGELGEAIQKLLKEYQSQTANQSSASLNTIEDMQNFMDKFPELRSRSHNVSKHVAIMGELARLVEVCSLMDVSQFEQELACSDDHNAHWRELMDKLGSNAVKVPDKLRLGLLYALRYETSANIHMVQSAMGKGGVPQDMVDLVNVMLRYGGAKSRGPGLFGNHDLMSKMTKNFMTSVQGVENVYAQHVPLIMDTVQTVMKGKLAARTHPIVPGSCTTRLHGDTVVPEEIMIFMVGGVTYEEGTKIAEFNMQMKGRVHVILGGSTVHNSTSFLDELRSTSL